MDQDSNPPERNGQDLTDAMQICAGADLPMPESLPAPVRDVVVEE